MVCLFGEAVEAESDWAVAGKRGVFVRISITDHENGRDNIV